MNQQSSSFRREGRGDAAESRARPVRAGGTSGREGRGDAAESQRETRLSREKDSACGSTSEATEGWSTAGATPVRAGGTSASGAKLGGSRARAERGSPAGGTSRAKARGAAAVRLWFALAEEALQTHRNRLDRINVYPVPDSDTGANMLATIRSSNTAVGHAADDDLGAMLATAGAEAMGSAQGNSGTLLAVLISGFAEPLRGHQRLTVSAFSHGLARASLRGWSALSQPMEGTMLSVLDAARDEARIQAAAAAEPESRAALEQAMGPVVEAARRALGRTEQQLEALSRAGVVDAGGLGLLIVLVAMSAAVRGEDFDHRILEGLSGWEAPAGGDSAASSYSSAESGADANGTGPEGVELMCTVRLDPLGAASLRHRLDELGESVIITPIGAEPDEDGSLRWRIHVHTDDADSTLAAVQEAGPLEGSTTTPLHP